MLLLCLKLYYLIIWSILFHFTHSNYSCIDCGLYFASAFRYIGQPGVIGEIVAGIVLGPSLLGSLYPEFFGFLFQPDSLTNLELISQLGLVLFMFVIGMEVDFGVLKIR